MVDCGLPPTEIDAVVTFRKALSKYKAYFKDSPHAKSKGTIVKQVVKQQNKYYVMRKYSMALTR